MRQQAIRFPDELHAAIKAEAERRGRPHSFSSVLIEWAWAGYSEAPPRTSVPVAASRETPAMARQRKLNDARAGK